MFIAEDSLSCPPLFCIRNVVEYLGSAVDDHHVYIFMSYEPQCLAKLLKKGLNEGIVRKYTRQILLGLEYVHSQG